jgi:epoxyqueuosine reductase
MRFTMARPEVSCHPETLLERARTVVSAALCYYAPAPEPGTGEGRLPRYAWRDNYALLRERLDELGRRLGGDYRVLVDANQHVDRAGAERSGVGFIGKNTMLITRTHGSWVVLGTLVTEVELEATAPVAAGCGTCTLCIDACPTGALDEPGVLDATRCLSYWTQTADDIPDDVMDALGDRVYGCDICQDVCPWNVGIEKRRADAALDEADQPTASLADWLTRDDRELVAELDRLFVPGNDARWLRRNALVAVGNVGSADDAPLVDAFLDDDRPVLRRVARRASERIGERA